MRFRLLVPTLACRNVAAYLAYARHRRRATTPFGRPAPAPATTGIRGVCRGGQRASAATI